MDKGIRDEIGKILVIRSATLGQTFLAIEWLKKQFPQAVITLLAQPEVKDELLRNPFLSEILIYDRKRFSIFQIERRLLNELKTKGFDLVTILYNNVSGKGYLNVDLLAFSIRSRYKMVFDSEGDVYLITLISWIYRRFIKRAVYLFLHQFELILLIMSLVLIRLCAKRRR